MTISDTTKGAHAATIYGSSIQLASGGYFSLDDIAGSGLTILDYAWRLASLNRFGGQTVWRVREMPR
jgi:hypothetical protein